MKDLNQVCNCLDYYSPQCEILLMVLQGELSWILGQTPRDNELLTILVNGLIRTSRQSFTSHVDIESTAQKALDDLFSNCLASVSVKGSNVYIMDMHDSSTNGLPCDNVLESNPLCIFHLFDRRSY